MPKDPACGNSPSFAELYDISLKIDALTRAAYSLSWGYEGLQDRDAPPILALLEMAADDLAELSAHLSRLEFEEQKAIKAGRQ